MCQCVGSCSCRVRAQTYLFLLPLWLRQYRSHCIARTHKHTQRASCVPPKPTYQEHSTQEGIIPYEMQDDLTWAQKRTTSASGRGGPALRIEDAGVFKQALSSFESTSLVGYERSWPDMAFQLNQDPLSGQGKLDLHKAFLFLNIVYSNASEHCFGDHGEDFGSHTHVLASYIFGACGQFNLFGIGSTLAMQKVLFPQSTACLR